MNAAHTAEGPGLASASSASSASSAAELELSSPRPGGRHGIYWDVVKTLLPYPKIVG